MAVVCVPLLSGCMSDGDFFGTSGIDTSLKTGSIPARDMAAAQSDEMTAMHAASSLDLAKLGNSPSPWANPYTGSAGVISSISETRDNNVICRDFRTTRHSYTGVDSFAGKACLTGSGQWTLLNFDKQG